jgi:hypothetical protein
VVAAFAAGGICVFTFVNSPASSPPVADSGSATKAAKLLPGAHMATIVQPAIAAPEPVVQAPPAATAAPAAAEADPAPAAPAKATAKRTATKAAHQRVARKRHHNSPFDAYARGFDPFNGGGHRGQRRYSGYPYGGNTY